MLSELDVFVNVRDRDLSREGIMLGEGRLLAQRMLDAGCEMIAIACTAEMYADFHLAEDRCRVHVLSAEELARIAGFNFHRGVIAAARVPELPQMDFWAAGCEDTDGAPHSCRIVVCPEINDPENLGSIYRSASALGWDAVLVGERCISPFNRRALRVSMGASLSIPTARISGAEKMQLLKDRGFLVLGTSIKPEAQTLDELTDQLSQLKHIGCISDPLQIEIPVALVFGNEFEGLSPDWEIHCDRLVTIPMYRGTDSLNVSVAAGIFMHELGAGRL